MSQTWPGGGPSLAWVTELEAWVTGLEAWVNGLEARVNTNLAWGDASRLSRRRANASSAAIEAWFVPDEASRQHGRSRCASVQASHTMPEARDTLTQARDALAQARDTLDQARNALAQARDPLDQARNAPIEAGAAADQALLATDEPGLSGPYSAGGGEAAQHRRLSPARTP